MAIIDVAGYISAFKEHAVEHGFHVHDERHFVETYSMRQNWEVDLHPEEACGGPLDLHLSLEIEPRTVLAFEDHLFTLSDEDEPDLFLLAVPNALHVVDATAAELPHLLILATSSAGIGGPDLPIEVTAIDSFASVTDAPTSPHDHRPVEASLADIFMAVENNCDTLETCQAVSRYLLENADVWLGENELASEQNHGQMMPIERR